jgi:hypothetical protein
MRPRKLSSESWKEALKFINKCPLCNTGYEAEQAALFAKHEAANLVHITCKNCRSYFMAMIVMLGQGLSSVGMITDLSFADVERLHRVEPISLDEALEGVRFIHTMKESSLV